MKDEEPQRTVRVCQKRNNNEEGSESTEEERKEQKEKQSEAEACLKRQV